MKLGQLFMFAIEGEKVTPETAAFLKKTGCGGVILFKKNLKEPRQILKLIDDLNDAAEAPLIVGVDEEGGRVRRLPKPFVEIPPMATLGLIDDGEEFAVKIGTILGRELAACGFNIDFAPVLDTLTNKSNPVIGDRAFSSDAKTVSRLGRAFIGALQDMGVAACGKHFPGHGDTDVDSHIGLPVLSHNARRMELCELKPFEAAIDFGVAAVMTAHVMIPNLDPRFLATVSKKITTEILRRKFKFDGLVFTDDITMKGISDIYSIGESAWRAIDAGADVVIMCGGHAAALLAMQEVQRAANDGLLSEDKIANALARVAGFKAKYCCAGMKRPSMDVIGCAEHKKIIKQLRAKI